jgi:16S rRNA A1518/A1519 N6-dimethyltransferase RsmA/KsgA/DIM1 with predicted DNA glycosylase/AP lyase activity
MFNENFFPTPTDLIRKILAKVKLDKIESVLEPSAGKGDIAEEVVKQKSTNWREWKNIDCVEIEPELALILKGKKFRVVYDDFLTFQTFKRYDLIIMNPPFDDGDKHLL